MVLKLKKIAIFAHYDKHNIVDPYVIHYLEQLQQIADVVFVSDCDLPHAEIKKVMPYSIEVLAKRHGMYDFGSYKLGYLTIENKIQDYDELILCNDSVYGPLSPLAQLWQKMSSDEVDFWGVSENYFYNNSKIKNTPQFIDSYHLQSFFLVFKKNIFSSILFKKFIHSIKEEDGKQDIISNYEIGLSQMLIKNGFRPKSLTKFNMQKFHNGYVQGVLCDDWVEYINLGMPFVKVYLLRNNPRKIMGINNNFSRIYDENRLMILNHLSRVNPTYRESWCVFKRNKTYNIFDFSIVSKGVFIFFCIRCSGILIFAAPVSLNFIKLMYMAIRYKKIVVG